jgi:hypothetical protein
MIRQKLFAELEEKSEDGCNETRLLRLLDKRIENIYHTQYQNPAAAARSAQEILTCLKLVPYLSEQAAFMEGLIDWIHRRTFWFGGQQVEIEKWVMEKIEPFIPPDLHAVFGQFEGVLSERQIRMAEWEQVAPGSPLSVSLVHMNDRRAVGWKLADLILPSAFSSLQAKFEEFFERPCEKPQSIANWIYEENMVVFSLEGRRWTAQFCGELAVAVIMAVVVELKEPSIDQIAQAIHFDKIMVTQVIQRLAGNFKLVTVDQAGRVRLSPTVSATRGPQRIRTRFHRLGSPARLLASDATKGMAAYWKLHEASIVRVLKRKSPISRDDLVKEATAIFPKVAEWRVEDFNTAIASLEMSKLLRLDPADSLLIHYVPD